MSGIVGRPFVVNSEFLVNCTAPPAQSVTGQTFTIRLGTVINMAVAAQPTTGRQSSIIQTLTLNFSVGVDVVVGNQAPIFQALNLPMATAIQRTRGRRVRIEPPLSGDLKLKQAIREAYAAAPPDIITLHTVELSHPSFTQPIRVVRDYRGMRAYLEVTAENPAYVGYTDGTDDYIRFPNQAWHGVSNTPFTFMLGCEFYADDIEGNIIHVASADTPAGGWATPFIAMINGQINGKVYPAGYFAAQKQIWPGQPYLLTLSWSSSNKTRLYINERLEATQADTAYTGSGGTNRFFLGPNATPAVGDKGPLKMKVWDFQVWNRDLDPAEIDLKWRYGQDPDDELLKGRWRINDGTGTNVLDTSGNGNTGVMIGGNGYVSGPAEFTPFAFDMRLPEVNTNGRVELELIIDNIDKQIMEQIEAALETTDRISVTYRPYLSNDLSEPQMNPPMTLYIREVTADSNAIRAVCDFGDVFNKRFPSKEYTLERFPGLV